MPPDSGSQHPQKQLIIYELHEARQALLVARDFLVRHPKLEPRLVFAPALGRGLFCGAGRVRRERRARRARVARGQARRRQRGDEVLAGHRVDGRGRRC